MFLIAATSQGVLTTLRSADALAPQRFPSFVGGTPVRVRARVSVCVRACVLVGMSVSRWVDSDVRVGVVGRG